MVSTAIQETLDRFQIEPETLVHWEAELGLTIPTDVSGEKQYSSHHINLFKNIRKHLALGRSLDQIKRIVSLPAAETSRSEEASTNGRSPFVSVAEAPRLRAVPDVARVEDVVETAGPSIMSAEPKALVVPALGGISQHQVVPFMERLVDEKDALNTKLVEAEKLNSHLYNVNSLFHRKVKDLEAELETLQEQKEDPNQIQWMNDKSKLQHQLLDTDRERMEAQHEVARLRQQLQILTSQTAKIKQELENTQSGIEATAFIGNWRQTLTLLAIEYDEFGLNIEPSMTRRERIESAPTRCFSRCAVLKRSYAYDDNPLWSRQEEWTLSYESEHQLLGEARLEFILDEVNVARAIYRLDCQRIS